MYVRKVRGQDRVGKITVDATEVALVRKFGLSLQEYVRQHLIFIAKKRKWKWFFKKKD